jgi:hypothetical protein
VCRGGRSYSGAFFQKNHIEGCIAQFLPYLARKSHEGLGETEFVDEGWPLVGVVVAVVAAIASVAFAAAIGWLRVRPASAISKALIKIWQDWTRPTKSQRRKQQRRNPRQSKRR